MTVGEAQPAHAAGRGGRAPTDHLQTYAGSPEVQPPLWRWFGGSASGAGTEPLDLNSRPSWLWSFSIPGQPRGSTHQYRVPAQR